MTCFRAVVRYFSSGTEAVVLFSILSLKTTRNISGMVSRTLDKSSELDETTRLATCCVIVNTRSDEMI